MRYFELAASYGATSLGQDAGISEFQALVAAAMGPNQLS
jgi:hypothetical protein